MFSGPFFSSYSHYSNSVCDHFPIIPFSLHFFSDLVYKPNFSLLYCLFISTLNSTACLCVDAIPLSNVSKNQNFRLNSFRKSVKLASSFVDRNWTGRVRLMVVKSKQMRRQKSRGRIGVFNDIGGTYEDGFDDVKRQLINFFTYKATRTVLHQLYEMNPPNYKWFYNFVATNSPTDGKRFLRELGKEKPDLPERVMITRLHLYGKWIKKLDHAKMYETISNENLELMRERLMESVIWPSDVLIYGKISGTINL